MSNLKAWVSEHFWIPETTREDLIRDNLGRSGISLPSLNDAIDIYLPESAGRLPELIGQYTDLNDIIMSSINRFKRENIQKPWDREEKRDRLRVYLAVNIANYVSIRPETFTRVVQEHLPPLPERSYA